MHNVKVGEKWTGMDTDLWPQILARDIVIFPHVKQLQLLWMYVSS
jgi:hypothetical protein